MTPVVEDVSGWVLCSMCAVRRHGMLYVFHHSFPEQPGLEYLILILYVPSHDVKSDLL